MQHIKNSLEALIQEKDGWHMDLIRQWPTIIGTLADKVHLERITDNTITLGVYESSWMQELYLLSNTLLKKINNHLDKPYIKHIRFKASIRKEKEQKKETEKRKNPTPKNVPLSKQDAEALAKISDEQLRSELKKLFIKCNQEK